MNIITCKFKERIESEIGDYFIVKDINSKKTFNIPSNQFEIPLDNHSNNTFDFLVEKNEKLNKEFLSLIYPEYKIGEIICFNILECFKVENDYYFELKSLYKKSLTVKALPWQLEFNNIYCRIKTYKRGYPILQNVDTRNSIWQIGEIKEFNVTGFSNYQKNDKVINTVIVQIDDKNEVSVNAGKWHFENIWNYKTIFCEVIGLSYNGLPKLVIKDTRHPKYEIGKVYNFIVKDFKIKNGKNNTVFKVIELTDETGLVYEVQAIPNQEIRIKLGQKIDCEVKDINYNLSLKQVNFDDPFFYRFEDIFGDKLIKDKYFNPYLNEENDINSKLKLQYEQKSGFWVFTFCNSILNKIKADCATRQDLKEYIIVNNLHTHFENWILQKGILRAIYNEEERKLTKQKINHILTINNSQSIALEYAIGLKYDEFISKINIDCNFIHIYYFIRFSKLNSIELCKIINKIDEILNGKYALNSENYHYINKIIKYITKLNYNIYKNFQDKNYLILNRKKNYNKDLEMSTFLSWLLIQYKLYKIIDEIELSNLLLSKIFRVSTFFFESIEQKSSLLYNAFYIVSNIDKEHICILDIHNSEININLDKITKNPNSHNNPKFNDKDYLITVKEKKTRGFDVYFNETKGFLPTQNVTDNNLKYFNSESLNWTIRAEFTLVSKDFNYFIAKQLDLKNENYLSVNNQKKIYVKQGDIIFGTVKSTTDFGFFVSTIYGDGLVHISEISNYYFDKFFIAQNFKKGMRLPLYVLDHHGNKLNLSLSKLLGTKYEKNYLEFIKYFDIENGDDNFEESEEYDLNAKTELEKGYIFETYALHQEKLKTKTKYLKFAKIFFSNTFNARSYLLNIYLEYFASLDRLDGLPNFDCRVS